MSSGRDGAPERSATGGPAGGRPSRRSRAKWGFALLGMTTLAMCATLAVRFTRSPTAASAAPTGTAAPLSDAWSADPPAGRRETNESGARASPADPTSVDVLCAGYAESMRLGFTATQTDAYAEAVQWFGRATHARPFSADAWAEKGFAELKQGSDPLSSLRVARALTRRTAVLSAAWFNEGEYLARKDEPERARLAYAVASALGNAVASSRLAGRSTCTATWTTTLAPIPVVRGWKGVLAEMLKSQPDCAGRRAPQVGEAEARREACRACEALDQPLDEGGHCDGPSPWIIANGHLSWHDAWIAVQDLGEGRFFVGLGADARDFDAFVKEQGGFVRRTQAPSGMSMSDLPEVGGWSGGATAGGRIRPGWMPCRRFVGGRARHARSLPGGRACRAGAGTALGPVLGTRKGVASSRSPFGTRNPSYGSPARSRTSRAGGATRPCR